jgi:hypothetical protein
MRRSRLLIITSALTIWLPYVIDEPQAQAQACAKNNVCVWRDTNWSGFFYQWPGHSIPDLKTTRYQNCPDVSLNDSISSFTNSWEGDTTWLVFWVDTNMKGAVWCTTPHGSANVPGKFNDKFSSVTIHGAASRDSKPTSCQ